MERIYSIYENRSSAECIGQRIRSRRKECGIKSCTELAKKLWGTSVVDDSDSLRKKMESIERGRSTISIDDLLKLSEILNCDPDYLLCLPSCTQPTRVATDIVTATGLSSRAVTKLQESEYYIRQVGGIDMPIRKEIAELTPKQILSRLLETDEFWRVLGNLALWTSENSRSFISAYNGINSGAEAAFEVNIPGVVWTNPYLTAYTDGYQDLLIASAARHFSEAAEKVLKDYMKEVSTDGE